MTSLEPPEVSAAGDLKDYLELLQSNCPGALRVFIARTPGEFSDAVEIALENAMQHMESGARFNYNRDERALTHELVGCLGGGGVHAQNEAYSNGHVDVTVAHPHRAAWKVLGECKIYDGPIYHLEGCGQLLLRYATGRLPRTFCLDFVQLDAISERMVGIRERMDQDLPLEQQGASSNHSIPWAFTTIHRHKCGDNVRILHLGCNVYWNDGGGSR